MKKLLAIAALLALLPSQLLAWSGKGHAIIADVARSRLTPVTMQNIRLLLGDDNLAAVAAWADDIRKDRDDTFGWHFVDIPKSADGFLDARDCFRPQDKDRHPTAQNDHHNCVVDRIDMFAKVLSDQNASRKDRADALKFLIHFVGDVHQPLHGIEEARGGNDIKVVVFGSEKCGDYLCNLHGAWDYSLIEHTGYSQDEYTRHLLDLIRHDRLEQMASGTPADWANESHRQARNILDMHTASIDQAYYEANIRLVDNRLALAGIRLAALLNDTLGKIPTKQLEEDLKKREAM